MINSFASSLLSRRSLFYAGRAKVSPAAVDPYFSNVSFLYNGGLLSPDVTGKVVTASGNFAASNNRAKFGEYSYYSDGVGDKGSIAPSADLDLGTGNFTVETWAFQTATNTYAAALELGINTAAGGILFIVGDGGNAKIYCGGFKGSKPTALNVWQHIVWQRIDGMFNVAVGGQFGTAVAFTSNLYHSNNLTIGATSSGGYCFPGNIGALRITKGIARYPANFLPPTEAFPTQ